MRQKFSIRTYFKALIARWWLKPEVKELMALKSKAYRNVDTFYNAAESSRKHYQESYFQMMDERDEAAGNCELATEEAEGFQKVIGGLEKIVGDRDKEIVRLKRRAEESQRIVSELEKALRKEESHPAREIGMAVFTDARLAFIRVNNNNEVIEANPNAYLYLGVEEPDLIGRKIGSLLQDEPVFNRYLQTFQDFSLEFTRAGQRCEHNTYNIDGEPFDVTGYRIIDNAGGFPVYKGGFVMFYHHKPKFEKQKNVLYLRGKVHQDDIVKDVVNPWMKIRGKEVYIDSKELESIDLLTIGTVFRVYKGAMKNGNTLIFKFLPDNVAEELKKYGVERKHIKKTRAPLNGDYGMQAEPAI